MGIRADDVTGNPVGARALCGRAVTAEGALGLRGSLLLPAPFPFPLPKLQWGGGCKWSPRQSSG